MLNFLMDGSRRCGGNGFPRWSDWADFLLKHIEGIAAYCDHAVPFEKKSRAR